MRTTTEFLYVRAEVTSLAKQISEYRESSNA